MPHDDYLRRSSDAWLDRRQDWLDPMRSRSPRMQTVYSSLLHGDPVGAARASGSEPANDDSEGDAPAEAVRNCRAAVMDRIQSLHALAPGVRDQWLDAFAALDVFRRNADEVLMCFEGAIVLRTSELREMAGRLRAAIEAIRARGTAAVSGPPNPLPDLAAMLDRLFPPDLDTLAQEIDASNLLDECARISWSATLRRAHQATEGRGPGIGADFAPLFGRRLLPDALAEVQALAAEMEAAGRCTELTDAIARLRHACWRHRNAQWS